MMIEALDHLVLTVNNIEITCQFYADVLGMEVREFGNGRKSLHFGTQKINLHQAGQEFEPKAAQPTPGSADLCFISNRPLTEIVAHLQTLNIAILAGPVWRTGANGRIQSIYLRDPDQNLLEIATYL